MEKDKCTSAETDQEDLEHIVQAKVASCKLSPDEKKIYKKLCDKYGTLYMEMLIARKIDMRTRGKTYIKPPKYYVMDESDDEIALEMRCPLTGDPSHGGYHACYMDKDHEPELWRARGRDIAGHKLAPGKRSEEHWKENISRAKIAKNNGVSPLTVAERKNRWKAKQPKKPKKTEEEKKARRAERNRKHYEKKLAQEKR